MGDLNVVNKADISINDILGNEDMIGFVSCMCGRKVRLAMLAGETRRRFSSKYNPSGLAEYSKTGLITDPIAMLGKPVLVERPEGNICGFVNAVYKDDPLAGYDYNAIGIGNKLDSNGQYKVCLDSKHDKIYCLEKLI